MKKVIIVGNKVRRVSASEPRKSKLTARNILGAVGIVAFILWAMGLIAGGG